MKKYFKNLLFYLFNYNKKVYPIHEFSHGYVRGFDNGKIAVAVFDYGLYLNRHYDYNELEN